MVAPVLIPRELTYTVHCLAKAENFILYLTGFLNWATLVAIPTGNSYEFGYII